MEKQPLVILTGPTAVGKTSLSIRLAKQIGAEIISADSMQVYKGMDIGTAKIKQEEMHGVKHYLIDVMNPDEEFNITIFKKMACEAIDKIRANGHIPLIVGGTGFYIQSVLYDIQFENEDKDTSYREELYDIARREGAEYLHDMLRKIDEKSADVIHYNNVKRVARAIEYYKQTGKKISEHNEEQQKKESPYNYVYFVLNDDRKLLCRNVSIPTTGGHSARRSAARTCISRIWMRTRPSHTLNTALKNLRATITGSRARWSRSKTKPRTRSPRSPTWWTSTNADAAKTPSSTNPAVTV